MVAYLGRTGRGKLNRYAYLGAGTAIAMSLVIGLLVHNVFGSLSGASASIFEGIASLTAVAVLTCMIFWMAGHSSRIRRELETRIEAAVTAGELLSISALAFVVVFREGLETVLFLTNALFIDASGTLIGLALGASSILLLSYLLIRGTYNLDIGRFFGFTTILLLIFAAGIAGYGVHELMEAGEDLGVNFGFLGTHAYNINPPQNPDGSYPILHERGIVGSILAALISYDGNLEWLRVLTYLGYWIIVGAYVRSRSVKR